MVVNAAQLASYSQAKQAILGSGYIQVRALYLSPSDVLILNIAISDWFSNRFCLHFIANSLDCWPGQHQMKCDNLLLSPSFQKGNCLFLSLLRLSITRRTKRNFNWDSNTSNTLALILQYFRTASSATLSPPWSPAWSRRSPRCPWTSPRRDCRTWNISMVRKLNHYKYVFDQHFEIFSHCR